jgi:hypothetical protein
MSATALEKRLTELELLFSKRAGCICRSGRQTFYHTASDLKRILNVACPLHPFRDLGHLSCVPAGMPLLAQDRYLCDCSPNLSRDWLAGKGGPLTLEEMEEVCRQWRQEFSEEARQNFRTQQKHSGELIRVYHRRKYAALPR